MSNTPLVDIIPLNGSLVNANSQTIQSNNVPHNYTSGYKATQTNVNVPTFSQLLESHEAQKRVINGLLAKLQDMEAKYTETQGKYNYLLSALGNKALPEQARKAQIALKLDADYNKPDADGWYTPYLNGLAKYVGASDSTLSRGVAILAECTNVIETRYKPDEPGNKTLQIRHIVPLATQSKIIPIAPVKKHGGDHRVTCTACGSEDIIELKKHVCRSCGYVVKDFEPLAVNKLSDEPLPIHPFVSPDESHLHLASRAMEQEQEQETTSDVEAIASCKLRYVNNTTPIVASDECLQDASGDFEYETWLKNRIGAGQTIYSTGDVDEVATSKYKSHKVGYTLNVQAYIAGDISHIYGSPLRLADGLSTNVLTWDIDKKDAIHYLSRYEYMTNLARAGAAPVCWLRRDGTCHIELYFDEPVNVDAAYAWACSVAPGLKDIEECYPINQKRGGRVSWPLYHRIGDKVMACQVECMFPDEPGELIKHPGIQADKSGLAALLSKAVTFSFLIPELPVMEQLASETRHIGGGLLNNPKPIHPTCQYDNGLLAPALDWWYDTHSWEYVTNGTMKNNRFCSPLHDDRTASVVINPNDYTATDYGRTGSSKPVCKDKFDWWILFNPGLNKQDELKRLIAEYRNRGQEQVAS